MSLFVYILSLYLCDLEMNDDLMCEKVMKVARALVMIKVSECLDAGELKIVSEENGRVSIYIKQCKLIEVYIFESCL